MTRKDYELIARAISSATDEIESSADSDAFKGGMRYMRSRIISTLCSAMSADNPAFDESKFRAACLGR